VVQVFPPFVETSTVPTSVVSLRKALRKTRLRGVAGIWIGGDQSSVLNGPEPLPALSESASAEKPVPPVRLAAPQASLRFQTLLGFEALFLTVQPRGGKAALKSSLSPPCR